MKLIYIDIYYTSIVFIRYSYICRSRETPARTHLEGLALVLRLKVQIYVGPKIRYKTIFSIGFKIPPTSLPSFVDGTLVESLQFLFILCMKILQEM